MHLPRKCVIFFNLTSNPKYFWSQAFQIMDTQPVTTSGLLIFQWVAVQCFFMLSRIEILRQAQLTSWGPSQGQPLWHHIFLGQLVCSHTPSHPCVSHTDTGKTTTSTSPNEDSSLPHTTDRNLWCLETDTLGFVRVLPFKKKNNTVRKW